MSHETVTYLIGLGDVSEPSSSVLITFLPQPRVRPSPIESIKSLLLVNRNPKNARTINSLASAIAPFHTRVFILIIVGFHHWLPALSLTKTSLWRDIPSIRRSTRSTTQRSPIESGCRKNRCYQYLFPVYDETVYRSDIAPYRTERLIGSLLLLPQMIFFHVVRAHFAHFAAVFPS